jgi:hypothetical protein
MKKTIIGTVETVEFFGKKFKARIDTGARMSSLDKKLRKKLNLGPILRKTKVKSSHGESIRAVIKTSIKIKNRKLTASFNLADRGHMKYKILIGRNILKKGFLIDITK